MPRLIERFDEKEGMQMTETSRCRFGERAASLMSEDEIRKSQRQCDEGLSGSVLC